MKKLLLLSMSVLIILGSCTTSIEKADKIIREQADSVLTKDIVYFSSTANFLYYADISNYWYPGEYTFKDILADKFKIGYKGLTRLDQSINSIQSDDPEIKSAIDELANQIQLAQKDIQGAQRAIENANGLFGMMSAGGLSGILDFANLFNSEEEQEKNDKNGREAPKNVKKAFDNLVELLFKNYKNISANINKFENKVFDLTSPSIDEKRKIRYNLKLFIRNKIDQQYNLDDTVSRNAMITILFDYYEKEYQLSNSKISENLKTEKSKEQNIGDETIAKILPDQHFYNKSCASRDNFYKNNNIERHWAMDSLENVSCSYIDISSIKVSTNNPTIDDYIYKSIEDSICELFNQNMAWFWKTMTKCKTINECLNSVNDTSYSFYFDFTCKVNVISNQKNILCTEIIESGYSGGAHYRFNQGYFHNFNLLTGKELKLDDFIYAKNIESLNLLAKKKFWAKYGERVALGDYNTTKFTLRKAMFAIQSGGVLFKFFAGEFGCNADGSLEIFLPFEDINQLMIPNIIMIS
jgi:peptidoglycan hydrolase CwlO-like protein